jgi:Spy/CpxP family protein refolding chaperone
VRIEVKIVRTVIVLVMSAGVVWAQEAGRPCQLEETAMARIQVLGQAGAAPPRDVQAAKGALAECQARQAKLASVKAETRAAQAQLDDLTKRYGDAHPEVRLLRARLDELRAQEMQSSLGRTLDATSLKQATGGLQTGLPDRWWKNAATAQSLGLTADQQKKMDDVFQQYRLKLIDLNAALEKEEVMLEPLVAAEPLDEPKVTAQIDRVAQARAELEKANGRMLLGIRKQLTPEQWNKLQSR